MHKYKLIEKKEDWKDSILEKSNIKIKFSVRDMEETLKNVLKIKEELEAQRVIDKAQVQNFINNYPGIDTISEEEEKRAIAITLRQGSLNEIEQIDKKLAEIEAAISDYNEEIEEIKLQTNVNE